MGDRSENGDYKKMLDSIQQVQSWASSGETLELNPNLCRLLSQALQITASFLQDKRAVLSVALQDRRQQKALRQLYSVVKHAEHVVRQCCTSEASAWPKRALTLFDMKEDVLDILLYLRWWTWILCIVIPAPTGTRSSRISTPKKTQSEFLERANKEFQQMLDIMALFASKASNSNSSSALSKEKKDVLEKIKQLHGSSPYTGEPGTEDHITHILSGKYATSAPAEKFAGMDFRGVLTSCIQLQNASLKDKKHLLQMIEKLQESNHGEPRSKEHRDYLLSIQVHTLLTGKENPNPDLNVCKYSEHDEIGRGAFGCVYPATWLGCDTALKTLRAPRDRKERNEVQILKGFRHPHIVKFFRHWEHREKAYIVMERMDINLHDHVESIMKAENSEHVSQARPFGESVAIDIMEQMMKAIWHMHSRNVVHRDLKPQNVLLRKWSESVAPDLADLGYVEVKLGDFGLARANMMTTNEGALTYRTGTTIYQAPELYDAKYIKGRNLPRKMDLWSFGIMSSQIYCGQVPFSEILPTQLLQHLKDGQRPSIPADCPDYLSFIMKSCWNFNPYKRPRSADVWKLLRLAKLRSLGLIVENNDLFTFKDHNEKVVKLTAARTNVWGVLMQRVKDGLTHDSE